MEKKRLVGITILSWFAVLIGLSFWFLSLVTLKQIFKPAKYGVLENLFVVVGVFLFLIIGLTFVRGGQLSLKLKEKGRIMLLKTSLFFLIVWVLQLLGILWFYRELKSSGNQFLIYAIVIFGLIMTSIRIYFTRPKVKEQFK